MLAADTAIPPQKSSFRGAARLGPRTSTARRYLPVLSDSHDETAWRRIMRPQYGSVGQPSSYTVVPERSLQL
jgi:hypothetical protein